MHQSINHSINQTISHSINQTIHQSINPINQTIEQLIHSPIHEMISPGNMGHCFTTIFRNHKTCSPKSPPQERCYTLCRLCVRGWEKRRPATHRTQTPVFANCIQRQRVLSRSNPSRAPTLPRAGASSRENINFTSDARSPRIDKANRQHMTSRSA